MPQIPSSHRLSQHRISHYGGIESDLSRFTQKSSPASTPASSTDYPAARTSRSSPSSGYHARYLPYALPGHRSGSVERSSHSSSVRPSPAAYGSFNRHAPHTAEGSIRSGTEHAGASSSTPAQRMPRMEQHHVQAQPPWTARALNDDQKDRSPVRVALPPDYFAID